MNENEVYMIPECNLYRTKVFSQEPTCKRPLTKEPLPMANFDSAHQLELKILHARERLAARIENEGYLICAELKRLQKDNSPEAKSIIKEILDRRIDALWLASAADYVMLCTLSYLSSVPEDSNHTTKSLESVKNALQAGFEEMIRRSIEQFSEQHQAFKERVAAVIDAWDEGPIELAKQIWRLFTFRRFGLGDSVHWAKIQAKLTSIERSGRSQYTYICEHSEKTCSQCQALAGQNFFVSDAREGVNLPPMHPNCRCTIQGYPVLLEEIITNDMMKLIPESVFLATIGATVLPNESRDDIGHYIKDSWATLFEDAIKEYYGTFTTINIGGVEYHINRNSFTAVAIGPDGELIVPENAKPYDKQMLELMRKRDELPEDSEERADILAQIERLDEENKENDDKLLSVISKRQYNFYVLGEDVTEQLNEYMRQTEIDYAHMHQKPWFENLFEFKALVDDFSKMDLKRQAGWQHSALIYNGEIIDQDAPGNINYGYFGTFCNIPKAVLLLGAGYAQIRDGTSDWDYWFAFFDDPRDTFRVLQGIDIYNLWH